MAKVVKAFSLDPDVARYIDRFPAGKKSEEVNWALRSYFFTEYGQTIQTLKESREYWMEKHLNEKRKHSNKQGVKHHLRELFKALFRVR